VFFVLISCIQIIYDIVVLWHFQQGENVDVMLLSPLLLLSKVVIFNWMGRPERDTILNQLGSLATVARSVNIEKSRDPRNTKIFGNLHIVLRDCPDITGVEELIMTPEKGLYAQFLQ
jgi:hypothetical protein